MVHLHNDFAPHEQVQTNSSMKNEIKKKKKNSHFLNNTCMFH